LAKPAQGGQAQVVRSRTSGEMQYHPAKGGKGKQHGCFYSFLDITRSEFHKIVQISRGERLLLVFKTFCHVVYATKG
jgi:hypothetical protein